MPKKEEFFECVVPTDPELSVIVGRNGTHRITQLRVAESYDHRHVYIEGIGKRGVSINGGLFVTLECFAGACRQFLTEYEKRFPVERFCAAHGEACCDICPPEGEKL